MADANLELVVTSKGAKAANGELVTLANNSKKAEDGFNGLSGGSDKLSGGLGSLGGVAGVAAKSVIAVGAAAVTATAGALTFTASIADSVKELERLEIGTAASSEDIQKLAFITGESTEKIADQFKDLNDRIGEFRSVGTGAFQDIADVLGLSAEEAQNFADELANIEGEDRFIAIAGALDEAGVSADRATFALESLADEASKTIGIFRNGASEADVWAEKYAAAVGALALSPEQTEDLVKFSKSMDLLGESTDAASKQIASSFAQVFQPFIDWVTTQIPGATDTLINFIEVATFQDFNPNIGSINRLEEEIASLATEVETSVARLNEAQDTLSFYKFGGNAVQIEAATNAYNLQFAEVRRLTNEQRELEQALKDRTSAEIVAGAAGLGDKNPSGVPGAPSNTPSGSGGDGSGGKDPQAEALENELSAYVAYAERRDAINESIAVNEASGFNTRNAEKLALAQEQYQAELDQLNEFLEQKALTEDEASQYRLDAQIAFQEEAVKIREKQIADELKAAQDAAKAEEQLQAAKVKGYSQTSRAIAGAFGENEAVQTANFAFQKGLAAGEVAMATGQAIAKASAVGWPANIPLIAEAVLTGAQAAALVASATIGAREQGGQVNYNSPYLVGERGPEVFVPQSAGSIIPNGKMGGGGVPPITIVNQTSAPIGETEVSMTEDEIVILIRETVSNDITNSNTDISKGINRNTQSGRVRL